MMTVDELKLVAGAKKPDGRYAIRPHELMEIIFNDPALARWMHGRMAERLLEGENDGTENGNDNGTGPD